MHTDTGLTDLQQIEWWFRNHTRATATAARQNNRGPLLSLTRKKVQMLVAYQAYMHLFRPRVMSAIKSNYMAYRDNLPDGEEARGWWSFTIEEAGRLLEQEPDEVKAEVEAFRQKHFSDQSPTALTIEDLMKDGFEDAMKRVRTLQR